MQLDRVWLLVVVELVVLVVLVLLVVLLLQLEGRLLLRLLARARLVRGHVM